MRAFVTTVTLIRTLNWPYKMSVLSGWNLEKMYGFLSSGIKQTVRNNLNNEASVP